MNKKKIYLTIALICVSFSFHINSYYRIKDELNLDLTLIQYLSKDVYSRYYPPFFDAIICGHLNITDDQLQKIEDHIDKKIESKKQKIENMESIIGVSYVDNFEFESTFFNCNISTPPMQKEINNRFKDIYIEEHDRRTGDIDIKKISLIIDEKEKEIWFTIK